MCYINYVDISIKSNFDKQYFAANLSNLYLLQKTSSKHNHLM
ncbi:MAG: BBE domain-containing protein [Tolypothrix sp. Co-bin9]|nr:BBE domain-containing protein [Tolypothrix sp. Co-bin9]